MKAFNPADWYRAVDERDSVLQGDQLFRIPLRGIIPAEGVPGSFDIGVQWASAIVATQSCDIAQRKVAVVEVIPFYSLATWLFHQPAQASQLESIRRGFVPGAYLLPGWPKADITEARATRVVVFDDKRSISWEDLDEAVAGQRLGLHHPYIEHFGQAVARFYMRIGLPEDIPPVSLKEVLEEKGKKGARVELAAEQFRIVALPIAAQPMYAIVGKVQLTGGPDVLYRAQLEQDKSFSGFGPSGEKAIESLLRLLARKRQELIAKTATERESPHWLLAMFPADSRSTARKDA